MDRIKVGIVGYGTIGKRVADAVMLQDDMRLVGVTGNTYNFRMEVANKKRIPIYTVADDRDFRKNNITPAGTMQELLKKIDIVIECSPKPIGKEHKEQFYRPLGLKAIFQGGEDADVADCSFVAQVNYDKAVGKDYIRVVSCNTTGLCRTLYPLYKNIGVRKVRATMVRRGTDPGEHKKGPINAIVPSLKMPSHHGPDVMTVIPDMKVFSTALIAPTTIMHLHAVSVHLAKPATAGQILKLWKQTPRVRIVRGAEKIHSTAQIMELARDLGNTRGDMMEICIWEEAIGIEDDELFYIQAVHQESDVVPENIDAIRAAMGMSDARASMEKTNKTLNL